MHRLCIAISVVGLASIASPLARAQEPATLTDLVLKRLQAGQRVRIHWNRVGRVDGHFVSYSGSLVTLHRNVTDISNSASSVDSLWVSPGGHGGIGALIGTAAGALAIGTVLLANHCNGPSPGGSCGYVAIPITVFVVGGAGIGAAIGAGFPKWERRAP